MSTTPTAEAFIAELSSEDSVREYLGEFAAEYSEGGITSIAEAYRNVLNERKDEIAEALAQFDGTRRQLADITLDLHLTDSLDVAIQAAQ